MQLLNKPKSQDVVIHDVTPLTVPTDSARYSMIGWLIVLIGVGGFFLWAMFAPLDKGVPVQGALSVDTNRKAVQHLTGGTIDDILVKEGDTVKAGQVLVRMNEVVAKSNYDTTKAQYITARSMEGRLLAERDGQPAPKYAADLVAQADQSIVRAAMELQSQLFSSRRAALQAELSAANENTEGLQAQVRSLQESQASKRAQQGMLQEQLAGMRDLAKDGFIARNRLLELERNAAQLDGALAEERGTLQRVMRQISELSLRKTQRLQEYQRDVRSQLAEAARDATALSSRLAAQELELKNTAVKAPTGGVVVGLNVFTRGGVVPAGYRMMDIVPSMDGYVVEGQIPVHLIDKVHAGLKVELTFSAFNQNQTPHISGIVEQVSADRLVDEHTGQPYYKMKARVTPAGMKKIAALKLQLRPGMPVDLFVQTGERTLMNYLLKPIFDRAHTSLSEE